MEVVTIEKATFEEIQNEVIEAISMAESLLSKFKPNHPKWLDNENVCMMLNISTRTIQNYKDQALVSGKKLRVIKKASFDDTLITWPNQLLCPLKETV